MKNVQNQFAQTLRMFQEFTNVDETLTFDLWEGLNADQKSAALFVKFYDRITLAWYNTKGDHTIEEDGVAEAIHICSKLCGLSVKQKSDKAHVACTVTSKTFTPQYIYHTMRNAFSSLNYERKSTRSQYQHPNDEITVQGQYFTDSSGTEADILLTVNGGTDAQVELEKETFWDIIESQEPNVEKIIMRLVSLDNNIRAAKTESALKIAEEKRDQYVQRNEKIIFKLRSQLAFAMA